MSNRGTVIAAKIEAGLARAGARIGGGAMTCTLRKASTTGPATPWDTTTEGTPDDYDVTALEFNREIRDAGGMLTGQARRTLLVSATGAVPEKDDRIAVGVTRSAVTTSTVWSEVAEVRQPVSAGTALMYEVDLVV